MANSSRELVYSSLRGPLLCCKYCGASQRHYTYGSTQLTGSETYSLASIEAESEKWIFCAMSSKKIRSDITSYWQWEKWLSLLFYSLLHSYWTNFACFGLISTARFGNECSLNNKTLALEKNPWNSFKVEVIFWCYTQ